MGVVAELCGSDVTAARPSWVPPQRRQRPGRHRQSERGTQTRSINSRNGRAPHAPLLPTKQTAENDHRFFTPARQAG